MKQLTRDEAAFAAEHHNLIFRYMQTKHLNKNEYYDIIVFGFLNGVKKHFRRSDLEQYSFTTLAWKSMNSAYSNYVRSQNADKRKAIVLSIHEPFEDLYPLEEVIADVQNIAEEVIDRISAEKMLAGFCDAERRIVELLCEGYLFTEIANILGINIESLSAYLKNIELKTKGNLTMAA